MSPLLCVNRQARRLRRVIVGAAFVALAAAAQAAPTDQRMQNERVTLYYGVVPAALSQAVLSAHPPPADVHGTVRFAAGTHHLVIALFDTSSGQRITQATVTVRHTPPRGEATTKVLEPMALGDTQSFGATFVIAEGRDHRFRIDVRWGERVERFDMVYDNLHGGP
ncbi:MAG: hypothetical protein BGP24_10035 [Lysobacterales bacterium 69-70]|nr:hypothetical protein [Xanthomonadaceae bacterium]ODU33283.1 MAG: hypothetical protein ABS97_13055 [Xanthomonadaceae bacterium SCN 69-320]ODV16595.1 MAG: hypothetical protein ABT27_19730 [Xanthomonadaceae bacterium SCN 69-25]OJZ00827.1 MAG: hypothetical protein BGP24_10035 [Xanthomonadales bacterium 69-70]